jgi:A/G-specific adenine glycosylase
VTISPFATALLDWYARHARDLPWRHTRDPYAIWVSEIMLQQTQVETVIPYFHKWMQRFPSLDSLAQASQKDVLSQWEGLGYYTRARNLHRAAQDLVLRYQSRIPQDVYTLEKLPGVGPYTAGAIASFAYNQDVPLVDANIRRILARVFDVDIDAASPEGQRRLRELDAAHLPPGRSSDYHQAMMDLASTICTPRSPDCPACPLNDMCLAHQRGVQEERPVLLKKAPTPHYIVTAAVICHESRYLITQRPQDGLLGGMWEFPGGKQQPGEDLPTCLKREIDEELGAIVDVHQAFGLYRHAYTHFSVTLHAFRCTLNPASPAPRPLQVADLRWVELSDLNHYPMGKIDRQIARRLLLEKPC